MSNNIEEDIRIVEEYLKPRLNVKMNFSYETIRLNELQAMKNILNEYKKNQKIVDGVKSLIKYDFNTWFVGDTKFPNDATKLALVKYIIEKLLKEE